jgi:prepilin-type N-terminal cleavage/methylation domain-containing protein
MFIKRTISGFTLVEILVVIGIIGVLASVVFASVGQARSNARDKARVSDIAQLQLALKLYALQNGSYQVTGTGSQGNGAGFVSLSSVSADYPKAVVQQLVEDGFLGSIIYDPLVKTTTQAFSGSQYSYMIYPPIGGWTSGVCLFASLENPTQATLDTMTDSRIVPATKTYTEDNFGMNYAQCI